MAAWSPAGIAAGAIGPCLASILTAGFEAGAAIPTAERAEMSPPVVNTHFGFDFEVCRGDILLPRVLPEAVLAGLPPNIGGSDSGVAPSTAATASPATVA